VNLLGRILDRGMVADGRLARLAVTVPDRPGNLARLTRLLADQGANVLDLAHRRAFADIGVRDVEIVVHVELRGHDHLDEVLAALEKANMPTRREFEEE